MTGNAARELKTKEELRQDFLGIEYAVMEEKVRHASGDLYRTETVVPVAIAVTYAWLYGGEGGAPRIVPWWMWWIPVIMAAFGAWRQGLRYRSLWGYHYYLEALEREFYGQPPVRGRIPRTGAERKAGAFPPYGWQSYWSWSISPTRKLWGWEFSPHGLMRGLFWTLLLVATVVLAGGDKPAPTKASPDSAKGSTPQPAQDDPRQPGPRKPTAS